MGIQEASSLYGRKISLTWILVRSLDIRLPCAEKSKTFILNVASSTFTNSCDLEDRAQTWSDIRDFWNQSQCYVLFVRGDFNEVTSNSERGSLLGLERGMDNFNNFIQDMQLIEISASNGFFTWHRGTSKSKLDRLLVNLEWLSIFPHLQASILKRNIFDHNPLIANSVQLN